MASPSPPERAGGGRTGWAALSYNTAVAQRGAQAEAPSESVFRTRRSRLRRLKIESR